MAVILSVNKRIEWMACNKSFTFGKLNKYEPVPLSARTYDIYDHLMPTNYVRNQRIKRIGYKQFVNERNEYLASLEDTVIVNVVEWFGKTAGWEDVYLNEIDFAMTRYGSVLTVVGGSR
ncbi:MAG: hypothetical protein M1480_08420 [Bacteroidetes bacterium]|nr:hypothetical protein [Bacteroidota bacterium]